MADDKQGCRRLDGRQGAAMPRHADAVQRRNQAGRVRGQHGVAPPAWIDPPVAAPQQTQPRFQCESPPDLRPG